MLSLYRPKTIKVLDENVSIKSQIFVIAIFIFLVQEKQKINKLDYIKLKSFCTAKETIHKMQKQSTD